MIETALAVRYSGDVEDGRTRPLRVTVERNDGTEVDVYLKVADGREMTVEGLANEMLGSVLAGDVGLPVSQPFFVEVTKDFVDALPQRVRERFAKCPPLLFGSRDAGDGWRLWNSADQLVQELHDVALGLFAFDAFTGNADRRPSKPNLLRSKAEARLMLIDHEAAFGFRMKLFPQVVPWMVGNLAPMAARGADSEHLFFSGLSGRADLPFDAIRPMWAGLTDVRLAAYDALLPDAWGAVRPALTEATNHIRVVRDRLDECLVELRRVLA